MGQLKKDNTTLVYDHLKDVVLRLKTLGIADDDILCAAWLHDIIEDTNTSFEELQNLFGKKTTSLVLSLTKDKGLPKRTRNSQYVKQLKTSPIEAKLVKLCDIASNLQSVHNSPLTASAKTKTVKQIMLYFSAIKDHIIEEQSQNPQLKKILDDVNTIIAKYGLKPIRVT
jgi:guanosine-3',5'-bis(diphosphate) 3'-pyrophosphohydrolase